MDKLNLIQLIAKGTTDVPEPFLEYAEIIRTPDVMPVMFKMVHANKNSNMDQFTEDELEKALPTVCDKGLNWEHGDEFIGHIKKAYLVKTDGKEIKSVTASKDGVKEELPSNFMKAEEGEPSYILSIGLVWKHRKGLRAKAEEMERRSKEGKLTWSMETFFNKYECSTCNQVFGANDKECDHLKNRFSNGTGRILRDLMFVGAGVVTDPADKDACNMAIGADKKEEKTMSFKTFETEDELKKFVDESSANLKASLASLETFLASSLKDVEALKAEAESLKKTLTEKDALAKTLESELASIRLLEKKRIGEARLAELVSAGFVVADETKEVFAKEFSEKTDEVWNLYKKSILASIVKPEPKAVAATVPLSMTETTPVKASVTTDKSTETPQMDALERILSRRVKNY